MAENKNSKLKPTGESVENDESRSSTDATLPVTPKATTLFSQEKLDRTSPELWPEQIPGVSEFASAQLPKSGKMSPKKEWEKDFDHEDISVLQGFGSLTAVALLEKVKDLQNLAYQLGIDESKEMTRGKFLNIFSSHHRRHYR